MRAWCADVLGSVTGGAACGRTAITRMLDLCAVHDTFTTRLHDSQSKFMVIESAVTALLSDDIQLDKSGRRWLDDDEYLVRERIHAAVQHESVEYVSRKVAKTQRV